jgi:predicted nucleotidyltransferase
MTKEEIVAILALHKEELFEKYALSKMALFGSFARNEANEQSDIDLSVETSNVDPYVLVHLKEELCDKLKRPIDLIRFRESMNPYLKQSILKDAIYV